MKEASISTVKTKRLAILSARDSMGDFSSAALSIKLSNCEKRLCKPTAVTDNVNGASIFKVPACTVSLSVIARGKDSPVKEASSTDDCPATTMASQGITALAFTKTRSSARNREIGTVANRPSTSIFCVTNGSCELILRLDNPVDCLT